MTNLVNIVEFSRVKRLWQRCEVTPGRRNVCRKIRVNNYKSQREIPVEEIPCHFLCLSKQPLRFVARMLLRSETLKWFLGESGAVCQGAHLVVLLHFASVTLLTLDGSKTELSWKSARQVSDLLYSHSWPCLWYSLHRLCSSASIRAISLKP